MNRWRAGDGPSEQDLRELFAEVPTPPGVQRWRLRAVRTHRSVPRRLVPRMVAVGVATAAVIGVASLAAVPARHATPPDALPGTAAVSSNRATEPNPETKGPGPVPSSTRPTGPAPSGASRPGAANTGIPPGTALRRNDGDLTVRNNGAVISDLLVTGTVVVQASDVTLRRVQVRPPDGAYFAVRLMPGAQRLLIEDSELGSTSGSVEYAIRQDDQGLVVRRCDLHNAGMGIAAGDNATIVDSYLHNLATNATAGVFSGGGRTLLVQQNTIVMAASAGPAIALYTDGGPQVDVQLLNNVLGGGRFTVQVGDSAGNRDIRVVGNRFLGAALYGPVAGWNGARPGNTWQSNVSDASGAPINP